MNLWSILLNLKIVLLEKNTENLLNFSRDNDGIQVISLTVIKRPNPKKLHLDIWILTEMGWWQLETAAGLTFRVVLDWNVLYNAGFKSLKKWYRAKLTKAMDLQRPTYKWNIRNKEPSWK